MIQKGVCIAFGTAAGVIPHGEKARELEIYASSGMTNCKAISTATSVAADAIGLTGCGVVAEGMRADLICLR